MSENDQARASAREPEQDERRDEASRQQQGERAPGGGRPHRGGGERRPGGGGGGRGRGRHGQQQSSQPQGRRPEASLNMDELRELAELFSAHGLTDFEFENEEIRVRLSRNTAAQGGVTAAQQTAAPATLPTTQPAPASPTPSADATSASAPTPSAPATGAQGAEEKAEDLHIITSPIVGTFYRASSPAAEPFVRAGSHVEHDTVVCIIEAMKLMNEIQAETTGTVEKIYVENAQPVEYGQPLFGIKRQ